MSEVISSEGVKRLRSRARSIQPLHVIQLSEALLKIQTVEAATALSKSTIYTKMASGDFPQAIRLGSRCTRWRAGDISAWLAAQAAQAA